MLIQNNKLLSLTNKKMGLKDTFMFVDGIFEEAINGIVGAVLLNGENDINLDFNNLQTVMSHRGIAMKTMSKLL